jgi:hypothetical protein
MSDYEKFKHDVGKLRDFCNEIMDIWPEGDVSGDQLQEIAVKHGLLKPEIRHVSCRNDEYRCFCEEMCSAEEFVAGVECFRKTPILTGK